MRKWSRKEIKEFVTSPEFKTSMDDMEKRMQEYEKEQRRQLAEFWADAHRILNTPMTI